MSVDLYVVKKESVTVLVENGTRETVCFLRLAVENALAQDSQNLVDSAVKHARGQWAEQGRLPEFIVQIGADGFPGSGSPIFKWPFFKRSYCFDHELPAPCGYLGGRENWGYRFRTVREQTWLNITETARRIDEGATRVYKDFWHGEVFKSGEEFLRSQGQFMHSGNGHGKSGQSGYDGVSPRVSKILRLIRFIQEKGESASPADLNFLGALREKAVQLGYPC